MISCNFKMLQVFTVLLIVTRVVCQDETKSNSDGPLIVFTSYGPVQGSEYVSSWTNKRIYSFQGIPYAKPPVEDLRFKDPVAPEKWTIVKDCTSDQSSCMQGIAPDLTFLNISFNTSEDCLYLNVYTQEIKPKGELLAVMVWIHGGGFMEGSGSKFRYGPDFLVAEGVVVVTLNYRLGAFGFLTLDTRGIPGNAGLKDQRFALQWVQTEIDKFGGDPSKVTLFGESAGSASVHLHYLSPLSKGLFHQVIAESGTALSTWAVRTNGSAYGLQLAKGLNCSAKDLTSVERCLRAKNAQDILAAQQQVTPVEEDLKIAAGLKFIPTVDTKSDNPFLPDVPSKLIEESQGSRVPCILGINSDEGILMLILSEKQINNITNNLKYFIPLQVRNSSSRTRIKYLEEKIKRFYFKNESDTQDKIKGFINIYSDIMFGYSTAKSAKAFRERNSVYLYYFSFNGGFKELFFKMLEAKYNITGVAHAEEMNYLFVRQKVNQTTTENSSEMITWRRLVRMWSNFAKYGQPTVEEDPLLMNITWSPVGKETTRYLNISDGLTMEKYNFLGPAVFLWDSIYFSGSSGIILPVFGALATGAAAYYFVV